MQQQKAILYARTATAQIADPANSIENQLKAIEGYCAENNIEAVDAYHDIASGSSFDRPGFTGMLDYIKQHEGTIHFLVVTDWSRFSRNAPGAIFMEQRLNKMGIKVICTMPPDAQFSELISRQHKNYVHVHH